MSGLVLLGSARVTDARQLLPMAPLAGKQQPMRKPLLDLPILITTGLVALCGVDCAGEAGVPSSYTRLEQLPAPKIVASAEAYPGGNHKVGNIIDGKPRTEYSSNAKGTNTFIEFDFGAPISVAAFRHVDRNDPATIASSELTFLDDSGAVVGRVPVKHVNQRGGVTFLTLPSPVAPPARALAGHRVGRKL
jgi:hypothetical protein